MKGKRVLALAMAAMMTVSGVGTTAASAADGEGVTLTLFGSANDLNKPFLDRLFAMYEEETGNKIDIQGIDTDNFDNIALTKFQTGDVPDVFMTFSGQELDQYNPEETFVDFSDAEWVSDVSDLVSSQIASRGHVYGIPYGQ